MIMKATYSFRWYAGGVWFVQSDYKAKYIGGRVYLILNCVFFYMSKVRDALKEITDF